MLPSQRLIELWPAAGLNIRAGDLELRWIDDELLVELADLASRGVHDPATMPFTFPWTEGGPTQVARNVLAYQWATRPNVGPDKLGLEFAVLRGGVPVGAQALHAQDWAVLRTPETGSWLGQEFHGQAIGTRMRALMLHACFEGLGAVEVTSTALEDNAASNAISVRTGYEPDGIECTVSAGKRRTVIRYRITRNQWDRVRASNANLIGAPVELTGFEEFRAVCDGTENLND